MALLFAHLEHQASQLANACGRAITQRWYGFDNYEQGDYLTADQLADAEAEQEVAEPRAEHSVRYSLAECLRLLSEPYDECLYCGQTRRMHAHPYGGACGMFIEPGEPQTDPAAGEPPAPAAGSEGRDAADRPTRISGLSPLGGTTVPAGVSAGLPTTAPPAGLPTLGEFAAVAVREVLAEHFAWEQNSGRWLCQCELVDFTGDDPLHDWRQHVALEIARRIDAATLGPAAQAANERIASALRVAGFNHT